MNALALFREKEYPTDEEIKEYLSGKSLPLLWL